HTGDGAFCLLPAPAEPEAHRAGDPARDRWKSLPVHGLPVHCGVDRRGCAAAGRGERGSMKVQASRTFELPRQTVWDALMDFELLGRTLPGVQRMTPVSVEKCEMDLKVLVPAITGRYSGEVEVVEKSPIESYRLVGNATGRLGWVRGEAKFHLADADGGTSVD